MEATGFTEACRRRGVPWLVIRGISDFGDEFKNDAFHTFASQAAAVARLLDLLETTNPGMIGDDRAALLAQLGGTQPAVAQEHPQDRVGAALPTRINADRVAYLSALDRMNQLVAAFAPESVSEFLVYESRLRENLDRETRYGSTETIRSERAEIVDRLNDLAQRAQLGTTFNDLVQKGLSVEEQARRTSTEQSRAGAPTNSSSSGRTDPALPPDVSQIKRSALRDAIVAHFTSAELSQLCEDIQEVRQESGLTERVSLDIVGGNSLPSQALNLIGWLERRGQLGYLVQAIRKQRPGLI